MHAIVLVNKNALNFQEQFTDFYLIRSSLCTLNEIKKRVNIYLLGLRKSNQECVSMGEKTIDKPTEWELISLNFSRNGYVL